MEGASGAAARRVRTLAGHVAPAARADAAAAPQLHRAGTAAGGGGASTPYATATGEPTSYAKARAAAPGVPWRRRADRVTPTGAPAGARRRVARARRLGGCHRGGGDADGGHLREGGRGHRQGAPAAAHAARRSSPLRRCAIRLSAPSAQITINRPERRNAFTPRTGAAAALTRRTGRALTPAASAPWPRSEGDVVVLPRRARRPARRRRHPHRCAHAARQRAPAPA
jgi:hypothetical protein